MSNQPIGIDWESSDVVRLDLEPLLQGQMRLATDSSLVYFKMLVKCSIIRKF